VQKIYVFPGLKYLFTDCTALGDRSNEIHENTTNGLVADTRHRQTDQRTGERGWSPYKMFLFFYFVNVTYKREVIQLQ